MTTLESTQKKLAQATSAVRNQETMLLGIGLPTFVLDERCSIASINKRTSQIFGYSKEELLGCRIDYVLDFDLNQLNSDASMTPAGVNSHEECSVTDDDRTSSFKACGITKDKGKRDLICHIARTLDPAGSLQHIVLCEDITELAAKADELEVQKKGAHSGHKKQ